jgi:thymidylate kinase
MFISIDGPSGAGKSTIVRHLAQMLVAAGENVHVTAEPSNGPIGVLCRELTESVAGHALACLYAADRYHHVRTEIRPHTESGQTVISDRYIPSGLVMQANRTRLLILVWDASPQPPVRMSTSQDNENGRGLLLVETLSTRWDWYFPPQQHNGGKVVWALLET